MSLSRLETDGVLIASIIPYFLEKGNFWFKKNLSKILEARKTQSFFEDNTVFLEKNQVCNFSQFLRKLDEMGYEKVLEVSEPGEFSRRGGIIDVFPVNSDRAFRFEFLGNKIEQIWELPFLVKDEQKAKEILKKRLKSQRLFSDLKALKSGDYLVHLDHGISRFSHIEKAEMTYYSEQNAQYIGRPTARYSEQNAQYIGRPTARYSEQNAQYIGRPTARYYVLEYAQGDKLYVPTGLERKLSRYIGFVEPKISRLGGNLWQKTKRKIKEDVEKFARELLEIYAKRKVSQRPPYLPENEIDAKLAAGFAFEETADQSQAMEDINKDLGSKEPMDRIICGDVGFGKTEMALRTMLKAVNSGYQAAMICPTTILANQHERTFKERLKDLPLRTAMLSRLQSKKEQKETLENLKMGKIDIVLGTHRLLSNDVEFKNLGLLVIDDEQKFGVRQKEKLKKMRAELDILSLSATPIPRTLYLALSSLKNISFIQTPPSGRLSVKTFILPRKEKIIKEALEREISRGGQVYYLHNRVETIEAAKKALQILMSGFKPKVKIAIAHGRLNEKQLIKVMNDFQNKKTDVLAATTIIENGLDLPNVNTLIVADAARLGLAQTYQIRGRIGRSHLQAFAYFLHGKHLSEKARLRLDALKEAEELGSGYKIALKDLEIRGAGNILGKEQSGNINKVGLNLYCQILSEAIEKLKEK